MSCKDLIIDELWKNINSFVNEIDLTMDYLPQNIIKDINNYLENIKNNQESDEFKNFIKNTYEELHKIEVQLSGALFSKKKIHSSYYNFLNDITLFNRLLSFKLFENESKNTKKAFVEYLYNIYLSTMFINSSSENLDLNKLSIQLQTFIDKLQKEAENVINDNEEEQLKEKELSKLSRQSKRRNAISEQGSLPDFSNLPGLNSFNGMPGMQNIMSSILGNQQILSIASDISHQMQNDPTMNPMTMLSGLMSGNIENSPLQDLILNIQQKVEMKINNGEIKKEELEEQAQKVMDNIDPNLFSPEHMENLMKDLNKK